MTVTDFQTIDFEGIFELLSQKDFSHEKIRRVIKQLREASSEQGFFYIKNHGIDQEEIDEIFLISKKYFDQPVETKKKDFVANNVGYSRFGQEKLGDEFQDYKESFNFKNDYRDKEHPSIFRKNIKSIDELLEKTWKLSRSILTSLALSLEIEPEYFNKAHTNQSKSETLLRLLHYPPVKDVMNKHNTIRAGSHSDFGTFTLLFYQTSSEEQLESSSGLQVRQGDKDINGNELWTEVPAKHGTVVVNIADVLSLWTEGRFKSAVHRVVIPDGNAAKKSRYAIAHFINPDASYRIYPAPSQLPAPHPATEVKPGVYKASFGEFEFNYGDTGDTYFQRRTADTNY